MVHEKWEQNIVLKIFPGAGVIDQNVPQSLRSLTSPAAVVPGAHDQAVIGPRIFLLNRGIGFERAVKILGVIPASDRQDSRPDILQMGQDVHGFPIVIIGPVFHHPGPHRNPSLEIELIDLGNRSHFQKKVVKVGFGVGKNRTRPGLGGQGPVRPIPHEVDGLQQVESPVPVEIIIDKPVSDRCLRGSGLQGRMGIDHSHRGIKTGIGDAPDSCPPIVIGIMDKPFDRVIGIRALINIRRQFFKRLVRPHIHIFALRHELAAHILEDKNKTFPGESHGWPQDSAVIEFFLPIGLHTVRCSEKNDGVLLCVIDRRVDLGEKLFSVPHGDGVFALLIILHGVDSVHSEKGCRKIRIPLQGLLVIQNCSVDIAVVQVALSQAVYGVYGFRKKFDIQLENHNGVFYPAAVEQPVAHIIELGLRKIIFFRFVPL